MVLQWFMSGWQKPIPIKANDIESVLRHGTASAKKDILQKGRTQSEDFGDFAKTISTDILIKTFQVGDSELKSEAMVYLRRHVLSNTPAPDLYASIIRDADQPLELRKAAIRDLVSWVPGCDEIVRWVLSNGERDLRSWAFSCLSQPPDESFQSGILEEFFQMGFAESDSEMRWRAVRSARTLWEERQRTLLFRTTGNPIVDALSRAVQLFSRLNDDEASQSELIGQLTHLNEDVRSHTAELLSLGIEQPCSSNVLRKLNESLCNSNSRVRAEICNLLFKQRAEAVCLHVPNLLTCLNDSDPEVRRGAAVSIGHLKITEATDQLLILLRDENDGVRLGALCGLSWMRNQSPHVIAEIRRASADKLVDAKEAENTITFIETGKLAHNSC